MRMSDWSSDVCSSDLQGGAQLGQHGLVVEPGHRLGERQCGLLAWGVVVDVAPDDETVEPFVGLAILARLARAHLHAVRAAVDLRSAQDDQVVERAFETGRVDGGIDLAQGLEYVRERREEHTSELQSLMRISYAVFCLKKTHTTH